MTMSDRLTEGVAEWRDHDAVRRAVLEWLDESSSPEFDGHALVAADDSTIAGFISVSTTTHFAGEVDSYIGELVVDRRYEGTGTGTALVRAAEALAVDAGHRCLTLTTGAANDRAIGFYEGLGFRPEDIKLTMVLSPD
jgi:ribosomal protein S18 acetylase RimI-like enzyme